MNTGAVKAVQVEDTLCLTGGADGNIRLWDLRIVEDYEERLQRVTDDMAHQNPLERIAEHDAADEFDWEEGPSGYTHASLLEENGPCVRTLEGHSKSVTALYYEDGCLVSRVPGVHRLHPGDRLVGQDHSSMGRCDWSMRSNHGHTLGHLKSPADARSSTQTTSSLTSIIHFLRINSLRRYPSFSRSIDVRLIRSWITECSDESAVRSAYSAIRGRDLGNVSGFRWRRTILGIRPGQWERRWCGTDVG